MINKTYILNKITNFIDSDFYTIQEKYEILLIIEKLIDSKYFIPMQKNS